VLIEKGNYLGFGFIDREMVIRDFDEARQYVKTGVETPIVQNLINTYLLHPKDSEILIF
jgi:DNA polymerase-3 subunit epsilon